VIKNRKNPNRHKLNIQLVLAELIYPVSKKTDQEFPTFHSECIAITFVLSFLLY